MTTFRPNCTLPPFVVSFVQTPTARGTFDITWASLSVIILCTWTVLHLNVPVHIRTPKKRQKYGLKFRLLLRKLKWMALMVVAPECLLGKAWVDMLSAHFSTKEMECFAKADEVEWTLTHAYFANMGGFALEFGARDVGNIPGVTAAERMTVHHRRGGRGGGREVDQQGNNNDEGKVSNRDRESATTVLDGESTSPEDSFQLGMCGRLAGTGSEEQNEEHGREQNGEQARQQSREQNGGQSGNQDGEQNRGLLRHDTSTEEESRIQESEQLAINGATIVDPRQSPQLVGNSQESQARNSLDLNRNTTTLRGGMQPDNRSRDQIEDGVLTDLYDEELRFPPHWQGDVVWRSDKTNVRLVNAAMQQLESEGRSLRLRSRQRNLLALQGNIWILDAAQLRLARELKILRHLPQIAEHDLEDQNKGDTLVKAIAVLQTSWLILQLLVRFAKHLPSSLLELVAAAFAACSVCIYGLFWCKPKDVGTPWYFSARYPTEAEILEIAKEGPTTFFHYRESYWIPNNAVHRIQRCGDHDTADGLPRLHFIGGSATGAVIFGAFHLFAWAFTFPTPVERLLWRITALLTITLPLAGILVDGLFSPLYKRWAGRRETTPASHFQKKFLKIISRILWVFAFPYLIARVYIIVEVFRGLCFLPPRAFSTTWISSAPHAA